MEASVDGAVDRQYFGSLQLLKWYILAYESDLGKKLISKLYKEVENLKGYNTYRKVWEGRGTDVVRGGVGRDQWTTMEDNIVILRENMVSRT